MTGTPAPDAVRPAGEVSYPAFSAQEFARRFAAPRAIKKLNLSSAPGAFVDRMNRAALAAAGLKPDDVTMVLSTTAGRPVPPCSSTCTRPWPQYDYI